MAHHMATLSTARDGREVHVGEIGWSAELLGTVPDDSGGFDRATALLAEIYGWRPVRGAKWEMVGGSRGHVYAVMVER